MATRLAALAVGVACSPHAACSPPAPAPRRSRAARALRGAGAQHCHPWAAASARTHGGAVAKAASSAPAIRAAARPFGSGARSPLQGRAGGRTDTTPRKRDSWAEGRPALKVESSAARLARLERQLRKFEGGSHDRGEVAGKRPPSRQHPCDGGSVRQVPAARAASGATSATGWSAGSAGRRGPPGARPRGRQGHTQRVPSQRRRRRRSAAVGAPADSAELTQAGADLAAAQTWPGRGTEHLVADAMARLEAARACAGHRSPPARGRAMAPTRREGPESDGYAFLSGSATGAKSVSDAKRSAGMARDLWSEARRLARWAPRSPAKGLCPNYSR